MTKTEIDQIKSLINWVVEVEASRRTRRGKDQGIDEEVHRMRYRVLKQTGATRKERGLILGERSDEYRCTQCGHTEWREEDDYIPPFNGPIIS